jgi:YggT family protein
VTYSLISIVNAIFQIYSFLILVEVIGSWIVVSRARLPDFVYTLLHVVHTLTSPVLDPIRRLVPNLGGLDLSPIIALILLQVLQGIVMSALRGSL